MYFLTRMDVEKKENPMVLGFGGRFETSLDFFS